jgi:hypothetical protein
MCAESAAAAEECIGKNGQTFYCDQPAGTACSTIAAGTSHATGSATATAGVASLFSIARITTFRIYCAVAGISAQDNGACSRQRNSTGSTACAAACTRAAISTIQSSIRAIIRIACVSAKATTAIQSNYAAQQLLNVTCCSRNRDVITVPPVATSSGVAAIAAIAGSSTYAFLRSAALSTVATLRKQGSIILIDE